MSKTISIHTSETEKISKLISCMKKYNIQALQNPILNTNTQYICTDGFYDYQTEQVVVECPNNIEFMNSIKEMGIAV